MRGVRKPWPPANVSANGHAVCSMHQAASTFRGTLAATGDKSRHARSVFNSLEKSQLRAVLLTEQHHLCIYCERRVAGGPTEPPIEHWRPLSKDPEHALNWENLYLSCPTDDTCDDAKGGRRLAWSQEDDSLPWPTHLAYESLVGFTSGGEMYVRRDAPLTPAQRRALELAIEDQYDGGRRRSSILNLNQFALVAARKSAIDSERSRLHRDFPGRTASPSERRALAAAHLAQTERPAFVSIRVGYLNQTLGKQHP